MPVLRERTVAQKRSGVLTSFAGLLTPRSKVSLIYCSRHCDDGRLNGGIEAAGCPSSRGSYQGYWSIPYIVGTIVVRSLRKLVFWGAQLHVFVNLPEALRRAAASLQQRTAL